MSITKFSLNHATAVFVLIFCIIIGGLVSYRSLPREAAPDIAIPIVIVSTPYFGVSPSDIESLVTDPVEKELKSLRGIKKMTSTSAESVSLVTLEFDTSVNIEDALQKVREKVDKVKTKLPPDAEDSEVIEVNASDWPVLVANISGDMDPARLKEIGEDIKDDIEKIAGVLRVDLAGGVEQELQILMDPLKMRHHGVSVDQISGAIMSENLNLPGGSIEIGAMKYLLRVPGDFKELETIRDLVVKSPEDQPVLLRDVAQVQMGYKEVETYSRLTTFKTKPDGAIEQITQPNISLAVVKRAGENIIDIADKSKVVIKEHQDRMANGVNVAILNDMSTNIRASVHDLENNIISGMLLVLAVLFFFMGGARNALMVAISVPLSMLISFVVLSMMGITLNMVVLFSLVLALGMLGDNAIVIVENVYRHASEGKDVKTAALEGTQEVGWAIIASTMTTVGAFFPMVFWPGVMGKFMGFLPMTVIITLLSSLFVALIINPTIASVFLKVKPGAKSDELSVPDNLLYRAYRASLTTALNHRVVVVILSGAAFVGTLMAFVRLNSGVEFFPKTTPEQFMINMEAADGSRLDSTDALMRRIAAPLAGDASELTGGMTPDEVQAIEAALAKSKPLIEAFIEDTGTGGGQGMTAGGKAPHYGKISVDLQSVEQQQSDPNELMAALRKLYERIPGATVVLETQGMGPPSGKPVNIEIVGEDIAVMADLARQVKDRLSTIPGVIDLDDDVELSRPEVVVLVDRKRAALAGVSTSAIAQTVRAAFNGNKVSTYRQGKDEYDIVVRLPKERRGRVEDLALLYVVNRDNFQIPLTEVATIKIQGGMGSIRHKDQDRVVSVQANAAPGFLPAALLKQAQERLKDLAIPPGYELRYTGESEDQQAAGEFLGKALLAALFIILLILVTQFNSIVQPMIILSSVILSLIGVLWSLILNKEPFGIIMTGIGIISLAGVVVNNAIVLIDFTNQLRARGLSRREAVTMAGVVRFRPVLLTAITTVLGLIPLVIGVSVDFVNLKIVYGGTSAEMWGPMARVVSVGLMVATFLTLIVVPVLYSLFDDVSDLFARVVLRRRPQTPGAQAPQDEQPQAQGPTQGPTQGPDQGQDGATETTRQRDAQDSRDEQDDADAAREPKGASTLLTLILSGLLAASAMAWSPQAMAQQPAAAEPAPTADAARGPQEPTFTRPEEVIERSFERVEVDLQELKIPATRTLDMKQARELLHKNSLDVKIAMTQIQAADATIKKAYSTLFPSLAAQFQGTLWDSEIAFQLAPNQPPAVVRNQFDWTVSASASMRLNARAWPLIQQAYINQELNHAQVALIKDELDFALTQTYYSVLLSRRALKIVAAQLAQARTSLKSYEAQQGAGVVKPFELTRERLRVSQKEKELEQARMQFLQSRQALAALLLTEPDFDVVEIESAQVNQSADQLKEQARKSRLNVSLERKVEQLNDKQLEEVSWQYAPTLDLNFTTLRPRGTVFAPGQWQWQLGFTVQWLLWDGGMREAERDERQAALVRQQLRVRQAEVRVEADIDQALITYQSTLTQLEAARDQVKLAKTAVEETQRAFKLGAARQLDVIVAEDQQRLAELAELQTQLQLDLAAARLSYLSGQR